MSDQMVRRPMPTAERTMTPVQATPPHREQLDEGGAIREQAFGSAKSGDASGTSGRARGTRGLPLRPAHRAVS